MLDHRVIRLRMLLASAAMLGLWCWSGELAFAGMSMLPAFLYPRCPCCAKCEYCDVNTPPDQYQIDTSGIVDGACSTCDTTLNGTFILDIVYNVLTELPALTVISNGCFWKEMVAPDPNCLIGGFPPFTIDSTVWRVYLGPHRTTSTQGINLYVYIATSGTSVDFWEFSTPFTTAGTDCSAYTAEALADDGSGNLGYCDWTAATVTITSL